MLRSTFYAFTTSYRGLKTSQKQLDITGHNITNVGTVGYTRQRADVYSVSPGGYNNRYSMKTPPEIGNGAEVNNVTQIRDQFLDIRFRRESAYMGEQNTKLATLKELEGIFDEIEKGIVDKSGKVSNTGGLMSDFGDLISKLQSLSKNTESGEFDSIVRDSALTLTNKLNHYANQIHQIREQEEYNLKEATVKKVNDLIGNIAALNKSIREVESAGGGALELKDDRNLMIDELSKYMKLDVQYNPVEVAGGIKVNDVTLRMVGRDGSRKTIIHNDAKAKLKVVGESGQGKKIDVLVDQSNLGERAVMDKLNALLKGISECSNQLDYFNKRVGVLLPGAGANVENLEEDDKLGKPASGGNQATGLYKKTSEQKTTWENAKTALKGAQDNYKTGKEAVDNAKKALAEAQKKLQGNPADPALNQAVNTAKTNLKNAQDKLPPLLEKIKDANKTEQEEGKKFFETNERLEELKSIKEDADKFRASIEKWKAEAKDELQKYGITGTFEKTGTYGSTKLNLKGAGGAVLDTWSAGNKVKKVQIKDLEKVGISQAIKNKVLANGEKEYSFKADKFDSPGEIKGRLDMLNRDGVFEYGNVKKRGIGFYEKMLDNVASKFAKTMNTLNDNPATDQKETLFTANDGSGEITAKNITVHENWLKGKYKLTATYKDLPGQDTGQNENVLKMIEALQADREYTTRFIPKRDENGNYMKGTNVVADSRNQDGDYIQTKDPATGTAINPPKKVANKDLIDYKANGELDAKIQKFVYEKDVKSPNYGKYTDGAGKVIADGRDYDGNYTKQVKDATGKIKNVVVANSYGVMYKVNGAGDLELDANGKPQLDAKRTAIDNKEPVKLFHGGVRSYLANTSNIVSLEISSTSNLKENYKSVLQSVAKAKASISSVSLDEEGINMMKYQKAYNASARMMTTLDEAIDKIINGMGVVGR